MASAPSCGENNGVDTLQALGELTETQLGLVEGLDFLQLWRGMETEKYHWVAPVLSSELSPGQHGSCESSTWQHAWKTA